MNVARGREKVKVGLLISLYLNVSCQKRKLKIPLIDADNEEEGEKILGSISYQSKKEKEKLQQELQVSDPLTAPSGFTKPGPIPDVGIQMIKQVKVL